MPGPLRLSALAIALCAPLAAQTVIDARCAVVSTAPAPSAADYPDCLFHVKLEVESVRDGEIDARVVIGVFWAFRDRVASRAAALVEGQRLRATLVPFASVEDEHGTTMRVDETDDVTSPLFFVTDWMPLDESSSEPPPKSFDEIPATATVERMLSVFRAHGGDRIGSGSPLDGCMWFTHYEYLYVDRPWQLESNVSPEVVGPIDAIVEFRDFLSARGIELLVVFVPRSCAVFPDLATRIPYRLERDGRVDRELVRFLGELSAVDVRCVDLTPSFLARRETSFGGRSFPAYLASDPHWAPWAAAVAARVTADRVREMPVCEEFPSTRIDSTTRFQIAALPQRYFAKRRPGPGEPSDALYETVEPASPSLLARQPPSSPVLLMGDSFSNVHRDRNSDFPSHFAAALGFPVQVVAIGGGGPTSSRLTVVRHRGLLDHTKLVVWQVVASTIAEPEKWRRIGSLKWR